MQEYIKQLNKQTEELKALIEDNKDPFGVIEDEINQEYGNENMVNVAYAN